MEAITCRFLADSWWKLVDTCIPSTAWFKFLEVKPTLRDYLAPGYLPKLINSFSCYWIDTLFSSETITIIIIVVIGTSSYSLVFSHWVKESWKTVLEKCIRCPMNFCHSSHGSIQSEVCVPCHPSCSGIGTDWKGPSHRLGCKRCSNALRWRERPKFNGINRNFTLLQIPWERERPTRPKKCVSWLNRPESGAELRCVISSLQHLQKHCLYCPRAQYPPS